MHAIPNHTNSNFQIAYFLVGSCFTPDAAIALLTNLKENKEIALSQVKASDLREKAKIIRANKMLRSDDEAECLEGEADLAEIEANKELSLKNITAAKSELNFINLCIEKVKPHCKFNHLSPDDAAQAAQQEEWKLELIHRAENYLLTGSIIPADHFATMRMHPEFETAILPAVKEITKSLSSEAGQLKLLAKSSKTQISIMLEGLLQLENKNAKL
jgi:hypothetical protein